MAQNTRKDDMPIAIIGMSCRFAGGASSPEKLWDMCQNGRSAWSEIPKDRFNADAFYHPDGARLGTSNVKGGHFLEGDIAAFDASFFNFSAEAAQSLDPQYRMQLETVFEALENAGLALEEVAGSDISVYAGAFFRDHHDALMRDVETMPRLFMTGNGAAMSANRVSHFFDLRGPSITVDTGCSTALAALHLACQSLKSGEAKASIITAANLMINPDMFISMSSLGFLSPDGKSYAFDDRANGYGRGEGISSIIIKPLTDALRDGDPVRAVIRQTALNQDGKTPTITSPSQDAQQDLVRRCYASCALEPAETAYVEAHGTGTKTGDPIEAAALGLEFGKGRSCNSPLLVGSIKTNIGHCEAASGLASLIKVVKSIEDGRIAPSINFERPNPDLKLDEWNIEIVRSLRPWPEHSLKRASISNFGYGGCNSHVIIEDPSILCVPKTSDKLAASPQSTVARIVCISGKDQQSAAERRKQLLAYLKDHSGSSDVALSDLAFTMNHRRSVFPWRNYAIGRTIDDLVKSLESPALQATKSHQGPLRIGMVFTGQGAQWAAMGKELLHEFPIYRQGMEECERHLHFLGARWSLVDEAQKDEHTSRVGEPAMSLVLCTALQISLTNLLRSWNIHPTAITSHSSGEVAAAYAAGALTAYDAMAIVYSRMQLATPTMGHNGETGGMLAVGVGRDEVEQYLQALSRGKAVVACENSQESVTISGDVLAIEELEQQLNTDGVFARKLKVGVAYHSHHMLAAAPEYLESISRRLSARDEAISHLVCRFFSPVTGAELHSATAISAQHWVNNMTGTVLFSSAFQTMCTEIDLDIIVEVGPHGALGGPIRQIQKRLSHPGKQDPAYVSCLTRGEDATLCMKKLAGELWKRGQQISSDIMGSALPGKVLVDLPTYPWTHDRRHWQEPARNQLHRFKEFRAHDLLGSPEIDCHPHTLSWRNIIRASNLPWVRHHKVQGNIILPGAGLICMAIEGVAQLRSSKMLGRVKLENVNIPQALVIPDDEYGVELRLSLRACSNKELRNDVWYDFHVVSRSGTDDWVEHCSGSIAAWPAEVENTHSLLPELQELLTEKQGLFHRHQSPQDFYNNLRMSEIYHGPIFQNLVDIRKHQKTSMCRIKIAATEATMPKEFESPYIIHPATLDNIFQAAYTASPSGYQGARVPRSIKSLLIKVLEQVPRPGDILETRALLHYDQARGFCSSAVSCDQDGGVLIEVDHLFCQAIGVAREKNSSPGDHDLRMKQIFKTSLLLNEKQGIETLLQPVDDSDDDAIIRKLTRAGFYYIHHALSELSEVDIKSFSKHQTCFYEWMKRQIKRADLNLLAEQSSQWALDPSDVQKTLLVDVQSNTVNGQMIAQVGKNLVSILRNEQPPLAVLLEDNLLYRYYEQDIRSQCIYRQVGQAVELLAHEKPGLRILEIGAGTGGCTSAVLGPLHGREAGLLTSYDFTDISSGFFPQARQKFERWGNVISYRKLDIEGDIASQGFDEAKYDGIVACRVLHATRNMTTTMANVHKLLRPGGWILLVEDTTETLDLSFIFGVLPGWWLSEETFRHDGPLLREDQWHTLLQDTGFSGVDYIFHDRENAELRSASLMISRCTPVPRPVPEVGQIVHLCYSSRIGQPPPGWIDHIREALPAYTIIASAIDSLDAVENSMMLQAGAACIVLDFLSSEHNLLANIDERAYQSIRSVLTSSRKVLWVSCGGALSSPDCEAALHLGLLRTLRCEHAEAKYVSLDLDTRHDRWSDSHIRTIVTVANKTILASHLGPLDIESECAERGGLLAVPRIFPVLEDSFAQRFIEPFQQSDRQIRLSVANPGLLDSLYFTASHQVQGGLADDEVDIVPAVFGLNFRDVMVALGQLDTDVMGYECSGVVQAAGHATGLQPGDRVCALLRGHWSNTVRVHCSSVARIPDEMSMQVAASVPMVFITAYCALVETARCRRGQTILIHAATGGVGQAAVKLAQWLGMEVFVTAGTPEKRAFLQKTYHLPASNIFSSRDETFATRLMEVTKQRGVDIVLNSLSGPLLRKTWHCLARFGHFVEIGKRDIEQHGYLDMGAFSRNVSFSSIDLIQIGHFDQPMLHRAFSKVMELLASKELQPVGPIHEYPLSEIKSAMRLMQTGRHMGKIVVSAEANVEVINVSVAPRLSADATYLIVGGLGGLGLAILEHLFELGARNLLVLSRSAGKSAESSAASRHLRKRGCHLRGLDCDISSLESLNTSLEWATANLPPIRGVIQAAMVLKDSIFETMSYSDFRQALDPKVMGTRNLHSCFSDRPSLDFFITLSSLSGVAGSASQANYASGGTYQDALMRHRASLGLPGVCIDLGIVKSVGYVSQNSKVAERLAKLRYRPLEEHEVMQLIDEAITTPIRTLETSQVITGIVAVSEAEPHLSGVAWRREPRFRGMVEFNASAVTDGAVTAKDDIDPGVSVSTRLHTELKKSPTRGEAEQIIAIGIQHKLSEMFMIPVDELDIMEPLSNYGVDSLVAVELRNWLAAQTESTVTIFDVMQSEHAKDLARKAASSSNYLV